jgi:hypothetical protein
VNDCIPKDVAVACDGRILTVGVNIQNYPLPTRYCAMAFNPDGTLPASAPADGMYTWDPPTPRSSSLWARLDAEGKIVIVSDISSFILERYNPPWSTP